MSHEPHTFCHYCGAKHTAEKFPKACGVCGQTTFINPTPVVVVMIRVLGSGLLVVRRDIEPARGKLAFPGGYVDHGESWQKAAARELQEETSGLVNLHPGYFELFSIEKATNGNLLIFCGSRKVILSLTQEDFAKFKPNPEVSELRIIHKPVELAWATHSDYARRYFLNGRAWPEGVTL